MGIEPLRVQRLQKIRCLKMVLQKIRVAAGCTVGSILAVKATLLGKLQLFDYR